MNWEIIEGDCRAVMAGMEPESVQCVVTSPPYWGLRDYGEDGQLGLEATPEEYVGHMVDVFRCVRRVLRKDGVAWLNLGDSYARSGGKGDEHRGKTSPKQTTPGICYGKHADRHPIPGLKAKDLVGIPWRVAFALQADGWWLRSDIIWHKPNPMPESVTDRCTNAHEHVFMLTKAARYYFDADAIREEGVYPVGTRAAKGSAGRREVDGVNARPAEYKTYTGYRNKRDVWTIPTTAYPDAHYAAFPEALTEPCVLAGSAPGDVVLDCFCGTGTVGAVSALHGRRFIGIELSADYCEQARRRIRLTEQHGAGWRRKLKHERALAGSGKRQDALFGSDCS